MLDSSPNILVSLFRVMRLALHLFYYVLLAIFYPGLNRAWQRYLLRTWSKHLLAILNIGIYTEGEQTTPSESGFLMIANHTSWLDIFVLNALHPACFVAKAEVRHWPLIGWLCQRSGTIFIERTKRKDTAAISLQISALLEQGICVALFPEGTSTDGKQVGHFHSSLIQPAIDAGVKICPIALQYRDASGRTSTLAEFTGDMTLADSVWRILRGTQLSAVAAFTPLLTSSDTHRRALARTAQQTISDKLHEPIPAQNFSQLPCALPRALLSAQSAYVLLLDPILHNLPK